MADLFGTYDNRAKITIDHTKIGSDLEWFPHAIILNDTDHSQIFDELTSDSDFDRIAFTTSDESTQLYADCELYNVSAGKAVFFVSKDGWTISSSSDTVIYLYFDSSASHNTTYISKSGDTAAQSVWDSNFEAVYHMNDATTSTIVDSTSNNNDGTKKGANEPAEATGKVGQGQDFDGSNDIITLPISGIDYTTQDFTIEAIIKSTAGNDTIFSNRYVYTGGKDYGYALKTDIFALGDGADYGNRLAKDTANPNDGEWHTISGVRDSTTQRLYIDGTEDNSMSAVTVAYNASFTAIMMGAREDGSHNNVDMMLGIVDEARLSSTARSAAWLAATYDSLWDNLNTITFVIEQSLSGTMNFTGSIIKSTQKTFVGDFSFSGTISRLVSFMRTLTGNFSFSGIIEKVRILAQSLFGGLNLSGRITQKAITKTILGTMDFVGSILKFISKILTGIVGFSGAVSSIRMYYRLISGILTSSGNLTKKITGKFLRGSLSLTGRLLYWLERIFGSVSWTEGTKSDVSWTEETKSDESWTEETKSDESWTEESKENENWEEHTH